jgi:hypothetical protein
MTIILLLGLALLSFQLWGIATNLRSNRAMLKKINENLCALVEKSQEHWARVEPEESYEVDYPPDRPDEEDDETTSSTEESQVLGWILLIAFILLVVLSFALDL